MESDASKDLDGGVNEMDALRASVEELEELGQDKGSSQMALVGKNKDRIGSVSIGGTTSMTPITGMSTNISKAAKVDFGHGESAIASSQIKSGSKGLEIEVAGQSVIACKKAFQISYKYLMWTLIVVGCLWAVIDRFTVNLWPLWVDSKCCYQSWSVNMFVILRYVLYMLIFIHIFSFCFNSVECLSILPFFF